MFIDEIDVFVKGGDGGAGCMSFRREKFIPRGGPDGGDGGDGGSIILEADPAITTLLDFHYQRHYTAERGQHGKGANKHGKSGADTILKVPLGTVVSDRDSGELLGDLIRPGQQLLVARGARGGRGNARFATSTNRAPRRADLPGLIPGAAEGKGLGHRFLRHTERTRLLVHLIDLDPSHGRDPVDDYRAIQEELRAYSVELAARPQIVAANKAELPGPEARRAVIELFCAAEGLPFHAVSAVTGLGLPELVRDIATRLRSERWAAAER